MKDKIQKIKVNCSLMQKKIQKTTTKNAVRCTQHFRNKCSYMQVKKVKHAVKYLKKYRQSEKKHVVRCRRKIENHKNGVRLKWCYKSRNVSGG